MPNDRTNTISDPIARDTWSYVGKDGNRHALEISVGRPFEVTASGTSEWACPLYVQGMTPGVKNVRGVGPIDALLNASTIVRTILDGLKEAMPREGAE